MPASRTKWRPRVSLAQLLLLVTAFAIAMAYNRTHRQLAVSKRTVLSLRRITRELHVDDRTKISAIARLPTLPGELIFDVYVPPLSSLGSTFAICFALEGIHDKIMLTGNREPEFPKPLDRYPITPGRHSVEVRLDSADASDPASEHRVEVLLDNQVVMRATRPRTWMASNGWSSNGSIIVSQVFGPGQPAELHRRRFFNPSPGGGSQSAPSDEKVNGIILWIETVNDVKQLP